MPFWRSSGLGAGRWTRGRTEGDEGDEGELTPETLWPDEEERERIQAAFNWVYEGTEHRDAIYREASEMPR